MNFGTMHSLYIAPLIVGVILFIIKKPVQKYIVHITVNGKPECKENKNSRIRPKKLYAITVLIFLALCGCLAGWFYGNDNNHTSMQKEKRTGGIIDSKIVSPEIKQPEEEQRKQEKESENNKDTKKEGTEVTGMKQKGFGEDDSSKDLVWKPAGEMVVPGSGPTIGESGIENKSMIVKSIYINCTYESKGGQNDAFSENPDIICDIIGQALSEKGYNIINSSSSANYILILRSSTFLRSNGDGKYSILSYYANVKGEIYDRRTEKRTFFSIFNDPDSYEGGKTATDAATRAFKRPALKEKILQHILPQLEN